MILRKSRFKDDSDSNFNINRSNSVVRSFSKLIEYKLTFSDCAPFPMSYSFSYGKCTQTLHICKVLRLFFFEEFRTDVGLRNRHKPKGAGYYRGRAHEHGKRPCCQHGYRSQTREDLGAQRRRSSELPAESGTEHDVRYR